jgi:hypothetical protein
VVNECEGNDEVVVGCGDSNVIVNEFEGANSGDVEDVSGECCDCDEFIDDDTNNGGDDDVRIDWDESICVEFLYVSLYLSICLSIINIQTMYNREYTIHNNVDLTL